MSFQVFRSTVEEQFNALSERELYRVDLDPDTLWAMYLESFPQGTNNIYKERQEHDCNFCKQFIKQIGNVVAIVDNKLISVWDVGVPYPYDIVSLRLSEYVKYHGVNTFFSHFQKVVSKPYNIVQDGVEPSGLPKTVRFDHFSCVVPDKFIVDNSEINKKNNTVGVFNRGLKEIEIEHLQIIIELINDNQLERGQEYRERVEGFIFLYESYHQLSEDEQALFPWEYYMYKGAGLYGTVIGTLIKDLVKGRDLTEAVNAYNQKANPENFRMSKTVVTERMVDRMLASLDKHGYRDSVYRRHATVEDVAVTDVLFADRTANALMKDPLKELIKTDVKGKKPINMVDNKTVTFNKFITDILPGIETLEIQVEKRHEEQFVNITAPLHKDAKNMFKWDNPYGWVYNMGYADSIKTRVKRAGGKVDAFLGIRLGWNNTDDLDLAVIFDQLSTDNFINYIQMHHILDGHLDIDRNRTGTMLVRDPVENITFNTAGLIDGIDIPIYVNNYESRERVDLGFTVEIECLNELHTFEFESNPKHKEWIHVCDVMVKNGKITITNVDGRAGTNTKSVNIWGITTNEFHRVNAVMLSPNFWGNNAYGQKHCFFMIDKCNNPEPARGFFNEYLSNELYEDRKALEVLGSRMKCEPTEKQLAGIGFSDSREGSILCKTTGAYEGMFTIKI